MRPILAALISAILVVLVSHFIEGLFNELIVAVGIGLLSGVGVMFAMRPDKSSEN